MSSLAISDPRSRQRSKRPSLLTGIQNGKVLHRLTRDSKFFLHWGSLTVGLIQTGVKLLHCLWLFVSVACSSRGSDVPTSLFLWAVHFSLHVRILFDGRSLVHRWISSAASSRCSFIFRLGTFVLVQCHTRSRGFGCSLAIRTTRIRLFPPGNFDSCSFNKGKGARLLHGYSDLLNRKAVKSGFGDTGCQRFKCLEG